MKPMLSTYYNNPELVKQLVLLGEISDLRERPFPNSGEKHSFEYPVRNSNAARAYAKMKGKDSSAIVDGQLGITTAFHRDRGEPLHLIRKRAATRRESAEIVRNAGMQLGVDFLYLYDGTTNEWFCGECRNEIPFVALLNFNHN